jgi:hypothetical protein
MKMGTSTVVQVANDVARYLTPSRLGRACSSLRSVREGTGYA